MRVLLIAPDQPQINAEPEIRYISGMHTVNVFAGTVTAQDLYQVCQHQKFDIIHISDHSAQGTDRVTQSRIPLSNGESLDAQDLVELAQASNARGLFINTCNSSFYAAYAVRRGIPFCVFTTLPINDNTAWKAPMTFYSTLQQMEASASVDFYQAYLSLADDGVYGWTSSRSNLQEYLLSPVMARLEEMSIRIESVASYLNEMQMNRVSDLGEAQDTLKASVFDDFEALRRHDFVLAGVAFLLVVILSIVGDLALWNALRGLAG